MGIQLESPGARGALSFCNLLRKQKNEILLEWFGIIWGNRGNTSESTLLQADSRNRFSHPVPYALCDAADAIIEAVIADRDVDRKPLEYAVKIRAVQEKDACRAISFIAALKSVVRDRISEFVTDEELHKFDFRIDGIAGIARESFLTSRAKISELAHNSANGGSC